MKKLLVAVFCTMLPSLTAHGQQDPLYAQYLNNPFVLNPAYAGQSTVLSASLQYRTQWAQFEGNPVTATLTGHMPVVEKRMGLGLQVIEDRIGDSKNTEVNVAYAYKLNLQNSVLSFGLQAGMIQYTNNPDELNIYDVDDPKFLPYSELQFNTGAGLLLTGNQFMLGLSVPRMLPATVSQDGGSIEVYSQNYYLLGSYLFLLSDKVRFKPSTLLRYTGGNPLSVDLNANFTFLDSYSAGLFTRNFNTYGVALNMRVGNFTFGYVFEVPTNQSVGTRFTSHEIMVGLHLRALKFHDVGAVSDF